MHRAVEDTLSEEWCGGGHVGWSAPSKLAGNDGNARQPPIIHTLNVQPTQTQTQIQLQTQTIPQHEQASRPNLRKRTSDTNSNNGRKRPRTGLEPGAAVDDRPRVACPFYLKDPTAYSQQAACHGKGFAEPGKLKDHLKAKPHSLSKDTLAKLKFKSAEFKSLGTIDAKWKRVFHILFPTVPKDRIPCPLIKHDRELPPLNAQEDLQKLCAALKRQVFDRFSVDLAVHVPDLWNEFEPLFDAAVEGAQGKENPPTPESSDAVPVQNESAMLRSLEWVQDLPSSPPGLQILHGFSTTLDQPQQSSFRPGHTAYGAHVANGISEIGPLSQSHFPVDYGSSYCATYYGDCIPLHSLPNPSEDAPVSQESRRPSSMDYEPTDQSSEHSSQDATSPCQTTLIKAEPEDTSPPVGYEFWRNRELMNDCRWHRHITRDAKPVIRQDSSNAAGRRASGQHGKGIVCRVDHAENRLCMPKIEDDSSSCSSPSFAANENENHNHAGQTETYDSSIASAGSSASPSLSSSWDEECIDYNDSSSLQISDEKQAVEVFSSEAVADAMPRNVQSFPFRRDTL